MIYEYTNKDRLSMNKFNKNCIDAIDDELMTFYTKHETKKSRKMFNTLKKRYYSKITTDSID